MSSATLLQVTNTNAEDVFLTVDPQFSFFKIVYHRHAAFSLETKEYLIPSNFDQVSNFYLPIDGDLISKIYLQIDLPALQFKNPNVDYETLKWKYYNIVEQPHIPYYRLQINTNVTTTLTPSIAIQVQNNIGIVLNSEILANIGVGITTQINETTSNNIFSSLLNQVSLFYSQQFNSIPSSSIITQMYKFYTNYSSINLQYVNNNSIFSALLINYLINVLLILYNNINSFETVIQVSLVYSGSVAFKNWKTQLTQYFANIINIPTTYEALNNFQIDSLVHNIIIYATNYVEQIDTQVETTLGITNIEILNSVVSTYTSGFNNFLFDSLVNLGYDYYYLYKNYFDIAKNATNFNLITIQNAYYQLCNTQIVDYLYTEYLNNNVSSGSSIKVNSLPDYSVVFKNAFLQVIDAIAEQDTTYNNIKNVYLINIYNLVKESLITGTSITLQNILDACSVARTSMLQLINLFIYKSFYLFNYQTFALYIPTINITATVINDFKNQLFNNITDENDKLLGEQLIFKVYPYFFYNKDTSLIELYTTAKGSELVEGEISELQSIIDKITYNSDLSFLTKNPFTQTFLINNIDILKSFVLPKLKYYVNVYEEFNVDKIISDYTYLSNIDKILNLISTTFERSLTDTEITQFTTVIKNYNTSQNASDLDVFIRSYGLSLDTVLKWFNQYPPRDTGISVNTVTNINPFKDTIILQSLLNEVFLEEMYYEYIYTKLLTLLEVMYDPNIAFEKRNDWFSSLSVIAKKFNLTPYETQVLYSYHFFNMNEIQTKIPKVIPTLKKLYSTTSWNDKITFLNIISYNQFVEYVRTNKKYFTYMYYEYVSKVNGTKVWQIVQTVENMYNIPLTVVEEFYYTPKITNIISKYTPMSYMLYEIQSLQNLDSLYENTISKLLAKDYKLEKPYVVEIVTKDTLTIGTFSEGKFNVLLNTIESIFLHEGYQVDFYRLPNYYRKIVSVQNTQEFSVHLDRTIIDQLNLTIVKSMTITRIQNNFLYKGLRIYTPLDILNNDIDLTWDDTTKVIKLKRKIPTTDNCFLYYEALRWTIYNDYHDLLSLVRPSHKKYVSWANFDITQPFGWVSQLGQKLIDYAEIYIDDCQIDSINSYWLNIYSNYFQSSSQLRGYNIMTGNVPELKQINTFPNPTYRMIIPLPFWFCKEPYLSLPIISLTKTKVLLKFKYTDLSNLIINYSSNLHLTSKIKTNVLVQYVFLDLEERMNFIQKKHYFLISRQRIFIEKNIIPNILKFKFNGPVSDIFLSFVSKSQPYKFLEIINQMRLVLNGKVIHQYKDAIFYTTIDPYNKYLNLLEGVYCISFNLYPNQPQPSGSMNFAYVNHGFIDYKLNIEDLSDIYAIMIGREYNILQIMSGQGALLYK